MGRLYGLIMAGGGGTRLWPLSREKRPKQMLPLVEESRTMFEIAIDRLEPVLLPEQIYVITSQVYADQLLECTDDIPPQNYIIEPFGQNTGPAVGLAVAHIRRQDPDAVIAVLAADHHIADLERFRRVIAAAAVLAEQDYLVTLGISPSFPSTGFGYIKRGEPLLQIDGFQVYRSEGFTEKPDAKTAIQFMADGCHSWNSGMFIFKAARIMQEFQRQQPAMYAHLQTIEATIGTDAYDSTLARLWPEMKKLSIDYAVMEGAENVAVIPVDIGWSDVGSWATLFEVLESDLNGNVSRGKVQGHVTIDTKETLIVSDRMVVTIGIEDIVIVDTDDVLLVCNRNRSQDVREVVARLKAAGDNAHL